MSVLIVNGLETPPEPTVLAVGKEFRVQVPQTYRDQVEGAVEWEVQVSTSVNNAHYSDWRSLGKVDISEKIFNYSLTELDDRATFFSFRYKLFTRGQETNWSEPEYAGRARHEASAEDLAGQITGTSIEDGAISSEKIAANSITADNIDSRALTADLAQLGNLRADAIRGGTLSLGGDSLIYGTVEGKTYLPFGLSNGDPFTTSYGSGVSGWSVAASSGATEVNFGARVTWSADKIRIYWPAEKTIPQNEYLNIKFAADPRNKIKGYKVNYSSPSMPTNLNLKASPDPNNSFADNQPVTLASESSSVSLQVKALNGNAIIREGFYIEIESVTLVMQEGAGIVILKDEAGHQRISLTKNYLAYQTAPASGTAASPARDEPNTTFLADQNGIWVPNDSLTVGSTQIDGVYYPQRNISDNFCTNPTFEILRNSYSTSGVTVPANWSYFEEDDSSVVTEDDTYFKASSTEVPDQQQSLVRGQVLVMSPTTDVKCIACSEVRRIDNTSEVTGLIPFTLSAFVRANAPVTVTISLVQLPASISSYPTGSLLSGTSLLGTARTPEPSVSLTSSSSFSRIYTAQPVELDPAAGNYIYLKLSTSDADATVEWDNVEFYIGEAVTPSDSLITADLRRQIKTVDNLVRSIPLDRKAVRKGLGGELVS